MELEQHGGIAHIRMNLGHQRAQTLLGRRREMDAAHDIGLIGIQTTVTGRIAMP